MQCERRSLGKVAAAFGCVLTLSMVLSGCSMPLTHPSSDTSHVSGTNPNIAEQDQRSPSQQHAKSKRAAAVPQPQNNDKQFTAQAQQILDRMSRAERIGQLFMVPLDRANGAASLAYELQQQHVGSVLLASDWTQGAADVKAQTQALQSMAGDKAQLVIGTDQEGGQVQHVQGPGFDSMPTALAQGQMSPDNLRTSAATWGKQLADSGINANLAPVVDTVLTNTRKGNAPIGKWDRDFGLDPLANGEHAAAFTQGMHDAHVLSSIKHFPGLGAVSGNTDFTAEGIIDTVTSFDPHATGQVLGFATAHNLGKPEMLMMSLATYTQLDPNNPAALSKTIIDYARNTMQFNGVIISDSLSAAALAGIAPASVAVRFVQAGGDLLCIGQQSVVQPMIAAVTTQDASDPAFAQLVDQAALRVLTMKAKAGLLK